MQTIDSVAAGLLIGIARQDYSMGLLGGIAWQITQQNFCLSNCSNVGWVVAGMMLLSGGRNIVAWQWPR